MRVEISCKKDGRNRSINGRGTCPICGSHYVYQPAPRVRRIDCTRFPNVYRWIEDDRGSDIVHVDDGERIREERGIWMRVATEWLEFPRIDRRKTARPSFTWERTGTRFEKDA